MQRTPRLRLGAMADVRGAGSLIRDVRRRILPQIMKSTLFPMLFLAVCLSGCIQRSSVEQRVVELPAGSSNATLATAAQIGQALVAGGLGADVQKQFPSLTQQQLQGLYLTWNSGTFSGTNSVFFLTGIRYTGSLPEAKAIADYCQSRVNQAVSAKFALPATK